MGLGFLTGLVGAYLFSVAFTRLGASVGLYESFSVTNADYIMNLLAGTFTGILTVYVSRDRRLRILWFVFGSLMVMDHVAFFSTGMPLADLIDRLLVNASFIISGLLAHKFLPDRSVTEKEAVAQ